MLFSVHTKLEKALLLGMLGNLVHDLVSMSKTSKAFTAYLDCLPPGMKKGVQQRELSIELCQNVDFQRMWTCWLELEK